jgi:beta-glucosidase
MATIFQVCDHGCWSLVYHELGQVVRWHSHSRRSSHSDEILREEWGYEYFVTPDAGATDRLATAFFVCPSTLNSYGGRVTEGN